MLDIIISESLIIKLLKYIDKRFSTAWRNSISGKTVKSIARFLTKLWSSSVIGNIIAAFFDADAGLKYSVFYRMFTLPVKKLIIWTADSYNASLNEASDKSIFAAYWRNSGKNIIGNFAFYISLFTTIVYIVYIPVQYAIYNDYNKYYTYVLAAAALLTLASASRMSKAIIKNSWLYKISARLLTDFWSEN